MIGLVGGSDQVDRSAFALGGLGEWHPGESAQLAKPGVPVAGLADLFRGKSASLSSEALHFIPLIYTQNSSGGPCVHCFYRQLPKTK